ncbi:hypothetical protein BDR05DRAFT_1004996 [Suillus weaverae]|nr:hypothetical protein BDR05DRAFT_1004996 [Suillus weaverae]
MFQPSLQELNCGDCQISEQSHDNLNFHLPNLSLTRHSPYEPFLPMMLSIAVQDFLGLFCSEGSYIFIEHSNNVKPVYHIQTATEIIATNAHFPTKSNVSVMFASEVIYSKPFMLQAMIKTIANNVSVTIVYVDSGALATYLVAEASKLDHSPFISGSGILMDQAMHFSGAA